MRDGGPTYGRPTPEQRLFEIARRMSPGTVGGLVRSAAPVQQAQQGVTIHRQQAGGAHFATVMVAADNATDREKAAADYQCNGNADEVEINAAIAECATNGGLVLLSSGLFTFAADITLTDYVRLAGMSKLASTLYTVTAGAGVVMSGDYSQFTDLYLYGAGSGSGIDMVGDYCEVDRARCDAYATSINCNSFAGMVRASHAYGSTTGINVPNQRARITDNLAEHCATGIVVDDVRVAVLGNQVHGDGAASLGHGISVTASGDYAEVVGNVVSQHLNNFHIDAAFECVVNSNRSDEPDNHCYYWAGNRGTLHDNVAAGAGGAASNTYDCFHIAGGAGSSIQGNSGSGSTARYGIRIDAGVTAALVTNNDVLSGASGTTWGTAAFSDAGTGTITTAGNRT